MKLEVTALAALLALMVSGNLTRLASRRVLNLLLVVQQSQLLGGFTKGSLRLSSRYKLEN